MGWAKPSATEELQTQAALGNCLIVDGQGRIHWHQPRHVADSRPWRGTDGRHRLARDLRAVPGPRWGHLHRVARKVARPPQRDRVHEETALAVWGASNVDRTWGWKAELWHYGSDPATRRRATVWLARLDPDDGTVERRQLRDTRPAEVFTWALRMDLFAEGPEGRLERAQAFRQAEEGATDRGKP